MSRRLTALFVILTALLSLSCGTARGRLTISVVASHETLSVIQDTEMLMVCGRNGAPEPPRCVPEATHRDVSAKLSKAFQLDADMAKVIRSMPVEQPASSQIFSMLQEISALANDVLVLMPRSEQKTALETKLKAR